MNFAGFMVCFVPLVLLTVVYLLVVERKAVAKWCFDELFNRVAIMRQPDFMVGTQATPYLLRWYLLPRNRFLNAYLHCFMRDDDDRALHDHPWLSLSFMLRGSYIEHTIPQGGMHCRETIEAGDIRFRRATHAHRIELLPAMQFREGVARFVGQEKCWTLFLTGPVLREWGFHCPQQGWVPWQKFTVPGKPGETGAGCDA